MSNNDNNDADNKTLASRRRFLKTASAAAGSATLVACGGGATSPMGTPPTGDGGRAEPNDEQIDPNGAGSFRHGVASGDPYSDSVLLWTRFTPEQDGAVQVFWVIATDPALTQVVDQGSFISNAARDYTVKVIAGANGSGNNTPLADDSTFYYQFQAFGAKSPIGRTRTAPASTTSPDKLRFAYFSCAMYSLGYFNAYNTAAQRKDLNAILFLGDYIYEYGGNGDLGQAINPDRRMEPPNETATLDDYRVRHAWYKGDANLQELHRQNPAICVWDDHESTNDSYQCGADNHTEGSEGTDGSWTTRKNESYKAYWEWMPVREQFNPASPTFGGQQLYRQFSYGTLLDVFMLDTRQQGRDIQIGSNDEAREAGRGMMSEAQERWLLEGLRDSTATWKLIGQQTMISQLFAQPATPLREAQPFTFDAWDGYLWQRGRIINFLAGEPVQSWRADSGLNPPDGDECDTSSGALVGFLPSTDSRTNWSVQNDSAGTAVQNVMVITGDIHNPFACEVALDSNDAVNYQRGASGSVAVEFVCGSVTMVGAPQGTPWEQANPHMHYNGAGFHGYTLLDITSSRCQAEWWINADINVPLDVEQIDAVYSVQSGSPYLNDSGKAAATEDDDNAADLAPS